MAASRRTEVLEPDLEERLRRAIPEGTTVFTLSSRRPNRVDSIGPEGVVVTTERSAVADKSEMVPAWMLNHAWHELMRAGSLEARELVKTVKRSSAVCALLAELPGVTVASTRPIRLEWAPRP